ncbi:unnamed protein product [Brassica rapa]|uniref:Uncharacterized protein n=1 Tax=Brassica campestris TaxID=3711 RepID=A0A8D9GS36_BRACM|nr:unnamed protein product [Brassica rapa]
MLEVVWTTEVFFRSGFDVQVFQIWKTSGTTYLFSRSGFNMQVFSDLEDFWDDLLVSRLEVVWKSSGLPKSRLDFCKVAWKSSNFLKVFGKVA